jgi:hypothetical protein
MPIVSQAADLNWESRRRRRAAVFVKGATTNLTVKWEDLTEQLFWQNTPLDRNQSFPVAWRSSAPPRPSALFKQFRALQRRRRLARKPGLHERQRHGLELRQHHVARNDATNGAGRSSRWPATRVRHQRWTATGLWHIAGDLAASPAAPGPTITA